MIKSLWFTWDAKSVLQLYQFKIWLKKKESFPLLKYQILQMNEILIIVIRMYTIKKMNVGRHMYIFTLWQRWFLIN